MVMPLVRSRAAALATVTQLLTPSNDSAPPNLPLVVHVGPFSVPVLPPPDASAVVVPAPSLNVYAATRPLGTVQVFNTVTDTTALVACRPAPSVAMALSVWTPFATCVVVHETLNGDVVSGQAR